MKYSRFLRSFGFLLMSIPVLSQQNTEVQNNISFFPQKGAKNINPDTHLEITFESKPIIGDTGEIRIYDATDYHLVDKLDMSVPPGPTERTKAPKPPYTPEPYQYLSGNQSNANTKPGTPSGLAEPTPDNYQLTIIGGFTDGFHFFPIIVHDKTAIIYPHNNLLEYGKTYYVEIDPGVLMEEGKKSLEIKGKSSWIFSTKKEAPSLKEKYLIVSRDGSGDFNTVQGAVDFIPDYHPERIVIFIKKGIYEEIVYFRNKTNITFLGEDREQVIIQYANREVFNPHPVNIATNEVPGTFPSRRAAFAADNCKGIHLVNMTIRSLSERAQAEGLLLNGKQNIAYNVTIGGSGDALQSNGSAYYEKCTVDGWGDLVLGRGPAFFKDCILKASGPFMWIRNTNKNHGNVFVNSQFIAPEGKETVIARAPNNKGKNYPYAEAVLINCSLSGIVPEGWGQIGGETENIHYWEYNSTNLDDGSPVDISKRHPASRQLTMEHDSALIANYSTPSFILNEWSPLMAPLIVSQPKSAIIPKKGRAEFSIRIAAIPAPEYQWFKNGEPVIGANTNTLIIEEVSKSDRAAYTVKVKNIAGEVMSMKALLELKGKK